MIEPHSILAVSGSPRHNAEKRFRIYGMIAIAVSLGFLAVMIISITSRGLGAFQLSFIQVEMTLPVEEIDPEKTGDPDIIAQARFGSYLKKALRQQFPEAKSRADKKEVYGLVSATAEYTIRADVMADPTLLGKPTKFWVRASSDIDQYVKGNIRGSVDQSQRRVSDKQIAWVDQLRAAGQVEERFNTQFFTGGDSREPEQAGILGAVTGSALTLLVCFLLSFPMGVLAAVYLEEFASKGRINRIIEININNLAAVPSIVFGLLGLAIFLNFFHLPRSTPLVGGMVLALMTLPTIIIASRASLRAVPPLHSRSSLRSWGQQGADDFPPRCATRHARHVDRLDHRHGTGSG